MSRNNDDRLGAKPTDEAPVAATEVTPGPTTSEAPTPPGQGGIGLNFAVPTEFVELPSKGHFYNPGHPLYNAETVEIRHMTAREEDILTSKTLLKKGIALDRLIESVLVDKTIKADDMITGDKNAILVMSRLLAYGADYNTRVTCPACYEQVNFNFNLNEHKLVHPDNCEDVEFERTNNNTFKFTLPKTNVVVETKLLTGADERWLSKLAEKKRKKKNTSDSILSDQMKLFIVSLNGVTDRNQIGQFISYMPASDSRFLRKAYNQITPNLDLTQDFECPSCEHETELEVPFTAEFFWPK